VAEAKELSLGKAFAVVAIATLLIIAFNWVLEQLASI